MPLPLGFIPPCVPTKAPQPPCGEAWLHEIKHDGSPGHRPQGWRTGEAVQPPGQRPDSALPADRRVAGASALRSCIIDGEAVACDDKGVASFDLIRHHRTEERVFLYAFDLIELNGDDLRRDPLQVRKATLRSMLAKAGLGLRFQ
jgi:bifunctional non-homologous end joining protein LigD